MNEYTFSYWVRVKQARLQRRKWWNIFGRDTITYINVWDVRYLGGLSDYEKEVIVKNLTLFYRVAEMSGVLAHPQLEVSEQPHKTDYVKTDGEQDHE